MDKKPQLHVSQKFILSALTIVCFALIAVSFFTDKLLRLYRMCFLM